MILKPLNIALSDRLDKADTYLPLTTADLAKLTAIVPNGEQIILTITDDLNKEYVLATNNNGTITLERGVDSDAQTFPKGSCVFFENSIPVTKWLICNYECCQGDCPVEAVAAAGIVLPSGKVGNAYNGSVVFSGALPMAMGVTGLPSWATATQVNSYIKITGVPTAIGSFPISVSACNDNGKNIVVQQGTIVIAE